MVLPGSENYSADYTNLKSCTDHPQDLNQFSRDPEIEKEECQRLLRFFMPDHTKQNKITQKLFIQ